MKPPLSTPAAVLGWCLRLLLFVAVLLELGTSLLLFLPLLDPDSLERLGNASAAELALRHLPSTGLVILWSALTGLFLGWLLLRGGDGPPRQRLARSWDVFLARDATDASTQALRHAWLGMAALACGGEPLFVLVHVLLKPNTPVLSQSLELMLNVSLAATFLITAMLLGRDLLSTPRVATAPPPEVLPDELPPLRMHALAPATSLPVSAAPGAPACAVCAQAVSGPRCAACGATVEAGGFRVVGLLGQHGHARTYRALAGDGTPVVLKEVSFALVPDAAALEAFMREGKLLQQLRHPRLPRFLSSFSEGSGASLRLYLAYAFVEGTSLAEELERRRYTESDAVELARAVLSLLTFLHGRAPPIIHRDVKPANLLRRPDGSVVLVDFGAARDLTRTTHQGTMVGTFGYMPREQLAGQVDATSDLYALGTTLLHVLTRRPPWELLDDTGQLGFPRQLPVSAGFRRYLQRLCAPRRRDRFPSAREALRELETLSQGGGGWVRQGLIGAVLAGGVAVALILAVGYVRLSRGGASHRVPGAIASLQEEPAAATFRGGRVTMAEVRERTARLPSLARGDLSKADTQRERARALVVERLVALKAAQEVPERPEWSSLPETQRTRLRIRELVERQVPPGLTDYDLIKARRRALSKLGGELYASADVNFVEEHLTRLTWEAHDTLSPAWTPEELRAARAELSRPTASLRFERDVTGNNHCDGLVWPREASFDVQCGCHSLPAVLRDEDVLYFDVFESGSGPNLLFAYNSKGKDYCGDGPRWTQSFILKQRLLWSGPSTEEADTVSAIVSSLTERFAVCLRPRNVPDGLIERMTLRWELRAGEVGRIIRVDAPQTPSGGPPPSAVEQCLHVMLREGRFLAVPDGTAEAEFTVGVNADILHSPWGR